MQYRPKVARVIWSSVTLPMFMQNAKSRVDSARVSIRATQTDQYFGF